MAGRGGGMSRGGGGGRSGGGRSGGGGSGRSFGSGGGRSFGGGGPMRGGSGGMGRPGGMSRGSAPGMGGGHRPSSGGRPPLGGFHPPHRHHHSRGHFHPRPYFGWGWRRPRRFYAGGGGGAGGCASASLGLLMGIVLILVLITVMFAQGLRSCSTGVGGGVSTSSVTRSTERREALPKGSVVETAYYTDELEAIGNVTKLTDGLKNFYQRTGVQPHLYLTNTIGSTDSPTDADVEAFAYEKYDALFTDEAHLLYIFYDYGDGYYKTWHLSGALAKTVLDTEAMDILNDYIDLYYYDDSLSVEEFFSKAFDEAGKKIMTVESSPWIPVMILAGAALILYLLLSWWKKAKQQKNQEAEQTERILNASLDSFGDREAEERAKKYEDKNDD